jgi:tripartite-type tricarboxylate transporter receptor subunit TctC
VTDILAGQIHMNIGTTATLVPLIQAGKLKALAVTGTARYPELPDVPTVTESGLPQLSFTFWVGMMAPAATPSEIVSRLNRTLGTVLHTPEMRAGMAKLGLQAIDGTLWDFGKFLADELRAWAGAEALTGVKLD